MSQTKETQIFGGRYQVLDAVGHGAAALVYKVRDRVDGTTKALKLLRSESAAGAEIVRRFEEEFRVLRGLHHPSLLEVFDYGWTDDDSRYMVMEFVEGQRLDHYLADHPGDLWVILYELCEVLTFIHSHNLLHLDIKPANILVKRTAAFGDEMPLVVLIDFGLTHRRGEGNSVGMVGTPEYMAPDVIRGETPYTNAVDYYSLGVSLYELITGELPFRGSGRDVFAGHLKHEPRFQREKVEYAELYAHIRGLMSKDKRRRLEAFEDFKRAVIARMTGGIHELEKAYGLARINSLGMIGKDEVWKELMEWVDGVGSCQAKGRKHKENVGLPGIDSREVRVNGLSAELEDESGPEDMLRETVQPKPLQVVEGETGSGKSFLVEELQGECHLRGIATLRLGSMSDAGDRSQSASYSFSDTANTSAQMLRSTLASHAVVLLIDEPNSLTSEEHEFLASVRARQELSPSLGSNRVYYAVVSRDASIVTSLKLSAWETTTVHRLLPLRQDDWQILQALVYTVPGLSGDRRVLVETIGGVARHVGGAMNALKQAATLGMGAYLATLADMQRGQTDESTRTYYRRMLDSLPDKTARLLRCVSCQPYGVNEQFLEAILVCTGSEVRELISGARSFVPVHARPAGSGYLVGFDSEGIRSAVYETLERQEAIRLHSGFVSALEMNGSRPGPGVSSTNTIQNLIHHRAAMGQWREAAILFRELMRRMKRARNWSSLSRLCRSALRMLDDAVSEGGVVTDGLRSYFVREMVAAEWNENRFHGVKAGIDAEYVHPGKPIPKTLMAKYVRSLRMCEGVDIARTQAHKYIEQTSAFSTIQKALFFELALIEHGAGNALEVRRILGDLAGRDLTDYENCRLKVYQAINSEMQGNREEALRVAESFSEHFRDKQYFDEHVILEMLKANGLIDQSRLGDAMKVIIKTLRVAHEHRLLFRAGVLRFQASGVYYERGDYSRSLVSLRRAVEIMESIGATDYVASYSVRYAMINEGLGLYGNASRYIGKAREIGSRTRTGEFQTVLRLVDLEVAVAACSENMDGLMRELDAHIRDVENLSHLAYYWLLKGQYMALRDQSGPAHEAFDMSRQLYERADHWDDATKSAIENAALFLEDGDLDRVRRLMKVISENIENLESNEVRCQYFSLKVDYLVQSKAAKEMIYSAAEECLKALGPGTSAERQLGAYRTLFRAFASVGEKRRALDSFGYYYTLAKRVISNLTISDAKRFLRERGVDDVVEEYKRLVAEH